jgi:5-bromo-4-chloroindolyl phosphate hydrolysis protein
VRLEKKPEEFILGETEMIIRAIGKLLVILLLAAYIGITEFFILHQNTKADFNFEMSMGKDINRIRRELKETELEEKTIRTITNALEDMKNNTQGYVQTLSQNQLILLMFIVPMIATFCTFSTFFKNKAL